MFEKQKAWIKQKEEEHPKIAKAVKIGGVVLLAYGGYKLLSSPKKDEKVKELETTSRVVDEPDIDEDLDVEDRDVYCRFFYGDTGEMMDGYVNFTEDAAEEFIYENGFTGNPDNWENVGKSRVELDYANDTYVKTDVESTAEA